jgi:magnesium-transporting ATPase (P-type)
MGITIVQERRTERALDALRDLSSPRALVVRDGQRKRIAGREVVRGDMVILSEGDRVSADAILRHSINLSADESLLRVLGVARGRPVAQSSLPQNQHDFEFTFLGMVGLADPIRPTVPQAIQECYSAGVRVVMITGDYPATAQSSARQIGLKDVEEIITGPELDRMDDAQLQIRLGR